jgi:hypothetical protein
MMTKTIVVGAKKVDVAKQEQRRSDRVNEQDAKDSRVLEWLGHATTTTITTIPTNTTATGAAIAIVV